MSENEFNTTRTLPLLPLRGLRVFPQMLLNFDVERPMSIAALNIAMGSDQLIFLTAQKDMTKDVPFIDDVYSVGTVCRVRQLLRQPSGKALRVMVEGVARARVVSLITDSPCLYVELEPAPATSEKHTAKTEAL